MKKILLVDDAATTRDVLAQGLASQGYDVVQAIDGDDALRRMQEQSFDLVITDVVMPERDGIELLLHLRRTGNQVKVIAISGAEWHAEMYLQTARQLGAIEVLLKPFRAEELFALVVKAFETGAAPLPRA